MAITVREAIEQLKKAHPDAILSQYSDPEGNELLDTALIRMVPAYIGNGTKAKPQSTGYVTLIPKHR